MTQKFITLDFKLMEKEPEGYFLRVNILETKDNVKLELSGLCYYFEEKVRDMAKKIWKDKKIFISYDSRINLGFFNFREFKRVVYPDN